ncbi:hypothetical protein L3Q82_017334 [Scortum barcoo]|uniref:Uncharacterized protein n=1 Tax=Scortum barcoo TaxID=214431 RepID=A0ACB8VKN4_9TELE|nr:hypothetical protein L3Q82_017334 [Scortum barcoo]
MFRLPEVASWRGPRSFPDSVNPTTAVVRDQRPQRGWSHVGSCSGDQQRGPQRCGPEEEEGTRRPGHGLPGHLQRCYDSWICKKWLVIAVGLVRAYLARGSYHGLYYSIEKPLKFFQTGAILEILHCAVGIVPSSVVLTGFQVMSRVFLTWAVTHSVREVQSEDSVLLFVTAWTVTEIIRYSFYTFSLLNHLPYLIKWARPGLGLAGERLVAGFAHGTRPGSARNGDVGPPSSRLTTRRKVHEGPVQCGLGSSRGREPRRPNPWNKTLAIGTWNVTSLGGKEPELVREVERYRLEIVGLTSTCIAWALEPSSLRGAGPSTTLELPRQYIVPGLLGVPGGVLDSAPTGDSIVLLGDFNAHVGNNSDTWRA